MGVRFLSQEWAEALAGALNQDDAFRQAAGNQSVRIQQVITTADDDAHYWLALDDGEIDLGVGSIPDPDATVTQTYETAVALARGELGAVAAFMTGKIKIDGNLMQLMQLQGALSRLGDVMRGLDVDY